MSINCFDVIYATLSERRLCVTSKDDMIRRRHLCDVFLKARGTSTFAIVNPKFSIRLDKVKIICMYAGFSTGRPQTLNGRHKPFKMR